MVAAAAGWGACFGRTDEVEKSVQRDDCIPCRLSKVSVMGICMPRQGTYRDPEQVSDGSLSASNANGCHQ